MTLEERAYEALADEAVRLWAGGEGGSLTERDAAITAALQALNTSPPSWPRRADITMLVARALRARYRTTYSIDDLNSAVGALQLTLQVTRDSRLRAGLIAELTRAARDLKVAVDFRVEVILDEAANALREELARGEADPIERADYSNALGLAQLERGDPDETIALLRAAVDTQAPTPQHRLELAQALASSYGNTAQESDLAEARELLRQLADTAPARDAFEAARFHGWWASSRGSWDEASDAFKQALAHRESLRETQAPAANATRWLVEAGSIPSHAAYALTKAGRVAEAVEALEFGLATTVVEKLGPGAAVNDAAPRAALTEPAVYLVVTASGGVAIRRKPDGSQPDAIELPSLTSENLHVRLLPYLGAYRTWALTASPMKARLWLEPLDGFLEWLGVNVMAPALQGLEAEGVTIITDGVLGLLPLHAATTPEGPLIDRVRLRYAPNARTLARAAATAGSTVTSLLAVSDPGDSEQARLPFAEPETELVAALFPSSRLLSGTSVSLANVEGALPGHDVVHLACHGFARFDDPLLSGIVVAGGGTLTLGRLLELRLDGTRLVTLSACESGLQAIDAPEEKVGLPSGLLSTGVAGVIASLWAVSDRSTMLLLLRFYILWRRQQVEPCEALRRAQMWLRDSTDGEISDWLRGLNLRIDGTAGEPEALGPLREFFQTSRPATRSYQQPFYWAAFAYHGA